MSDFQLYLGDCLEFMKGLPDGSVDAVVTDPPYGMGKGDWDYAIPKWLHLVSGIPTAVFCGVIGMRDYPTPAWVGAWVRAGSTQRNGALGGFNNWEPILFYNIAKLDNDVISVPNYHDETGHPTTKPTKLMTRLIAKMPAGTIFDPFMGSGTTGVACMQTQRNFIGCEIDPNYFAIAKRRIEDAKAQLHLFPSEAYANE
jgi:DNA modification methylase